MTSYTQIIACSWLYTGYGVMGYVLEVTTGTTGRAWGILPTSFLYLQRHDPFDSSKLQTFSMSSRPPRVNIKSATKLIWDVLMGINIYFRPTPDRESGRFTKSNSHRKKDAICTVKQHDLHVLASLFKQKIHIKQRVVSKPQVGTHLHT